VVARDFAIPSESPLLQEGIARMTSDANGFEAQHPEVAKFIEGIPAMLIGPLMQPIAAGLEQPLTRQLLREGIAFSERCQEAIAATQERFEDLTAEVQAELAAEHGSRPRAQARRTYQPGTGSHAAEHLTHLLFDLNEQVGWLTNNIADLRVLLSFGFAAMAIRQLAVQGPELDKIPWYTFAWYAFSSFRELHRSDEPTGFPQSETETSEVQSSFTAESL